MKQIIQTITLANSGSISGTTITGGTPVLLNSNNTSVGIGFVCVVTGTVNYTVYHSYDNLSDTTNTPTWLPHGNGNLVAATTTQEGNFVIPMGGIQVIINSGNGSVKLIVLQQGII